MKNIVISMIIGVIFGIVLSTFILGLLSYASQNQLQKDVLFIKDEITKAQVSSK